jgi:transposase InsO family protein/transposase-like protein
MQGRTKAGRTKRESGRAERRRKLRESGRRSATTGSATGRRFTAEQKEHALTLVASGGMTRERIASLVGTTTESLRHWVAQAESSGTMPVAPAAARAPRAQSVALPGTASEARSPYAPHDPGQGLSGPETAAILEYKQKHPSMGPAQIRAQLKRFKGWRMSVKAIARVLRAHGYEPVHRGSRPQGPEPQRFEAVRRNALWQMDFTDLRVDGEHLHLVVLQDDFSRYVVGHQLADSPETKVAIEVLLQAITRHGKPEAVRTDRGGAFTAAAFTRFLENELIDHVLGRAYHPQGGGKVESVIGTVKRELWEVEHFQSRAEASRRLAEFFVHFNERRAHMGIDGLTPADRFFGRAEQVLATVDALSRKRQGAHQLLAPAAGQSEEILAARSGQPLEVLRLVIADGHMELRFCGARVRLGPLES